MNENTFVSQRTHTRIKYNPLTVGCELVCITPMSPAAQTVNVLGQAPAYEPDRSLTPTVIFPDVRALDPDNVFGRGPANAHISLDTIAWTVDDKPIAEVWTAGTDYEIDTTESTDRGSLTVKKNLPASEKAVLRFKAQFLDWRTGIAYTVESNDLALTCTDKGADAYACSVDKPHVLYDPLFDGLLLYEYKVARDITVQGTREEYVDGKCYEQTVTAVLNKGTESVSALPDGITMKLYTLGGTEAIAVGPETHPEVLEIAYPVVKFDMRLVNKGEYELRFEQGGKVLCNATIGLRTSVSMPANGKPVRGADIAPSQDVYNNSLVLNLDDRMVEYPELYYLILWYTQAKYNDNGTWKYAAEKIWQRGERMQAVIADLDIGVTVNDSYFDLYFDVNPHVTQEVLTDESGEVLTDEDGEVLIG